MYYQPNFPTEIMRYFLRQNEGTREAIGEAARAGTLGLVVRKGEEDECYAVYIYDLLSGTKAIKVKGTYIALEKINYKKWTVKLGSKDVEVFKIQKSDIFYQTAETVELVYSFLRLL